MHDPQSLGIGIAIHHNDFVHFFAPAFARFDQQGHVKYQHAPTTLYCCLGLFGGDLADQRVNDRFQFLFGLGVLKYQCAHGLPVHGALGIDHLGPKGLGNRSHGPTARSRQAA